MANRNDHYLLRWLVILLVFLVPTISFGQAINDSLLAIFYNKTIIAYFSNRIAAEDQAKFSCTLLQTEFDATLLIKNSNANKFKYFTRNIDMHAVLDRPFKKNKDREIYWINHKVFGRDTVDINIGGWTLGSVTNKTIRLGAWCGGGMGYIPNARFVYLKEREVWLYISRKEIIDQKTKETFKH